MDSQKRQTLPIALAVLLAAFVGATIILGIVAVMSQRRAQERALRAEAKESEAQLAKSQAGQAQKMAEGLNFETKLLAYVLGYQGLTQAELDTVVQKLETNARASKVLQDFREAGALYGEGLPPDAARDYRTLLSNMAFNTKSRDPNLVQVEEQILGLIAAREEAEALALTLARVSAEAPAAQVRSRMAYELAQYAKNRKSSLSSLPGRLSPILETLAQDPNEEVQKTATAALADFRTNESPSSQVPRKPSPPVKQ